MAIKTDNLNLNLNLNLASGASGAGASGGRARFNTEDFPKAAIFPPTPNDDTLRRIPALPHRADWDAEGRAWLHVAEFIKEIPQAAPSPAPQDPDKGTFEWWLTDVQASLDAGNANARCPAGPNARQTLGQLNDEIAKLVDASLDRGDRLQEILDQADGEGALNYWTGLLALNPAKHPNMHLLIRVGRRLGELVVMRLKGHYLCPRPSRIHPMIVPAIDPPDTPAYPSGHATQAHLISELLIEAIEPPVVSPNPGHVEWGHLKNGTMRKALRLLADRVAENRTVAGLHYVADNKAGEQVAMRVVARARHCPSIAALIGNVRTGML